MKWTFVLSVIALGWTYLGYPLAILAHALYRPVGFGPPANPERLMEIRRPDIYTTR